MKNEEIKFFNVSWGGFLPTSTHCARLDGNGNARQKIRPEIPRTTARFVLDRSAEFLNWKLIHAEKIGIVLRDAPVATTSIFLSPQIKTSTNAFVPDSRAHSPYRPNANPRGGVLRQVPLLP